MKTEKLKDFFRPDAEKLVLLFIIDFFFTFILMMVWDSMGAWSYLMSPNSFYLENTLNLSSKAPDVAIHAAVSNFINIFYIYFLSCLIVAIYKRVRRK